MRQVTFQAAFRCTESNLRAKLIPRVILKGGKSSHRVVLTGQVASLNTGSKVSRQIMFVNAVYELNRISVTKN